MKKINCFLVIAAAVLAASCVNEPFSGDVAEQRATGIVWEAEIVNDAPDTRTALSSDKTKVYWQYGDGITFYCRGSLSGSGVVTNKDNLDKKAVISIEKGFTYTPTIAIHDSDNIEDVAPLLWTTDKDACIGVSRVQTGKFSDANISAAKVVDGSQTLRFYNLTPVFEVSVTDPSVRNVTIECSNTVITGVVQAVFNDDGSLKSSTKYATDYMTISIDVDAPGLYYAALMPGKIAKDQLSITYKDADGKTVGRITYPKALDLVRGQLYTWGDITEHDTDTKTLPSGSVFNKYMKQLAGNLSDIRTISFYRNNSTVTGLKIAEDTYMKYDASSGAISVYTSKPMFYANRDCFGMFSDLDHLENISNLWLLNTSMTEDMTDMFYRCEKLKALDLSYFDTSNVTRMGNMFYECNSLETLDLTSFNTRKVTYMGYMFEWCYALKEVFLGRDFVMTDGCFVDEALFGVSATWYGTTETMHSFTRNLVPGTPGNGDYTHGTMTFAIDMGEAGWWSAWNVGADKEWQSGYYYTWQGRDNSGHWLNGTSDGYAFSAGQYVYGAAYGKDWDRMVSFGKRWRMPENADITALRKCCTVSEATVSGVHGLRFTHKTNGNSIFFPSAGYVHDGKMHSGGAIWLGDYQGDIDRAPYFDIDYVYQGDMYPTYYGLPVRPVAMYGTKKVTDITLDRSSVTLHREESCVLTATVTPSDAYDKAVRWTSSNTSVATVSAGKVTAVGIGTAVITARNEAAGVSASCTVTVKRVNPTSFRLVSSFDSTLDFSGDGPYYFVEGGQNVYAGIRAVVSPSNADYHIQWERPLLYINEYLGSELGSDSEDGSNPFLFMTWTAGKLSDTYLKCTVTSIDGSVKLTRTVNMKIAPSDKQCIYVRVGTSVDFKPNDGTESFFNLAGDMRYHQILYTGDSGADLDYYLHFNQAVQRIPADAFKGNDNLKGIRMPDGVQYIGENAFYDCDGLAKVEFNNGLKKIERSAFISNGSLNNLAFPSSLEEIGDNAFEACSKLSKISFNEGLKRIGSSAFKADTRSNTGPVDFTLPGTLEYIGESAFVDMRKSGLTIPASVRFIGSNAFNDCGSLKTVRMEGTVPPSSSGDGPFGKGTLTKLEKIYVRASAYNAYASDPYFSKYKSIMVTY